MRIFAVIFCLTFLTACSFQEYFVIINSSEEAISVEFSFGIDPESFDIFNDQPEVYELNEDLINWSEPVPVSISKNVDSYQLDLPKKCALVLGRLNNEHFESVDQDFINGRKFNFKELKIIQKETTEKISKSTFSNHFVRKNGYIQVSFD